MDERSAAIVEREQYQPELFIEFQKIAEMTTTLQARRHNSLGTRTHKRGDRRRSRTLGRIKGGDGDGGEPVRSPSGRSSFHRPDR